MRSPSQILCPCQALLMPVFGKALNPAGLRVDSIVFLQRSLEEEVIPGLELSFT